MRCPQGAPDVLDGHQPHPRRAAGTVRPHRHHPAAGRRPVGTAVHAKPLAAANGASASSPTHSTNVSGPNTATGRCRSTQFSVSGAHPRRGGPARTAASRPPARVRQWRLPGRRRSADDREVARAHQDADHPPLRSSRQRSRRGRRKPHSQQNRICGGVECLPRNFGRCGMTPGRRRGRVGGVVTRSIPH